MLLISLNQPVTNFSLTDFLAIDIQVDCFANEQLIRKSNLLSMCVASQLNIKEYPPFFDSLCKPIRSTWCLWYYGKQTTFV